MKATWKNNHQMRLTPALILALLFGGRVTTDPLNPNRPASAANIRDDALQLIIEEGRRQIDSQADRFRHVTDRAQALLTAALVAVAFAASIFGRLGNVSGAREAVATSCWVLGSVLLTIGVAAAAATAVVRADFSDIDATQMTHWDEPALRKLAADYGSAVVVGETTVAARITAFRQSTRFVCWGVLLVAAALAIVQ